MIFTPNQVSSRGIVKPNTGAEGFLKPTYDILINYFVDSYPKLLLFSALVSSNLKIGFLEDENVVNDLNVQVRPIEIDRFASEVKKYLPKINQSK